MTVPLDRQRLAKLASDMVRAANLTWDQVVLDDRVAVEAARQLPLENDALREEIARLQFVAVPRSPMPWADPETYQDAVPALLLWAPGWETKFLRSLLTRQRPFTDRQAAVLESIGEKDNRCMNADWRAS
jgi:hypothetical protein